MEKQLNISKPEKTRQFIIEKTAPIFNIKGYAGTSISDMTDATGLTKGSIYGNFNNKDEVALSAFDYNMREVSRVIKNEMDKHNTMRDKLLVYPYVYENYQKVAFPTGGCPLLNTATEVDDTHPELKQRAADALYNWKKIITKLIDAGVANKEFNADTNAEQTALTIIAMIEGAVMISRLTGKTGYLKGVMQAVRNLITEL